MSLEEWWLEFQIDPLVGTVSEVCRFFDVWSKQIAPSTSKDQTSNDRVATYIQDQIKRCVVRFTDRDVGGTETRVKEDLDRIAQTLLNKEIDSIFPRNVARRESQVKALRGIVLSVARRIANDLKHDRDKDGELEKQKLVFFTQLHAFGTSFTSTEQQIDWHDLLNEVYGEKPTLIQKFRSLIKRLAKNETSSFENMKLARYTNDPQLLDKIITDQDSQLETLANLRNKMQRVLGKGDRVNGDVIIHRVKSHLFSPASYASANDEIDLVLQSSLRDRPEALLMLRTRFELMALQEMTTALRRASRCYQKIALQLESNDFVSVLEDVAELYWLQRRLWQAAHKDVVLDVPAMRAFLKDDVDLITDDPLREIADTESNQQTRVHAGVSLLKIWRVMCRLPRNKLIVGGGQVNDSTSSDVEVVARSSMFQAVEKHRDVVRSQTKDLLKYASKVDRLATLSRGSQSEFTTLILLPFLIPVHDQWESNLQEYLKPMTIMGDGRDGFTSAEGKIRHRSLVIATPSTVEKVAASLSQGNMMLIQTVKAIRLFMQIGAAFVAQKVFNESYIRKVFAEGRDPPPLNRMLFLMMSIDATTHLLLILILVLASFAFKSDDNTFIIDDIFLYDMLIEFSISSMFLIILGTVVADIMRRKRYFQYADQGQVVSNAYRTALLSLCMVNFVVPFSLLIS